VTSINEQNLERGLDPLALSKEADEDMSKQKPFHCQRCHNTWFGVEIEWIEGLPLGIVKTPDRCPCCKSTNWESKEEASRAWLPDATDGIAAYCKMCDKEVYLRPNWLEHQNRVKKTTKNPWLPTVKEVPNEHSLEPANR